MKEKKEYIGQLLKAKRSEKGISLEKASKDTRITQSYLKAIEDEQFHKVPGEVVLKGFIRVYSDYLGMDSRPLIAELNKRIKKAEPAPVEEPPAPKLPEIGVQARTAAVVSAGIVAFVILLLLIWAGASCSGRKEKIPPLVSGPAGVQQEGFTIKVEILQKTWLAVRTDGREVFSGVLRPGSGEAWSAREKIIVRMGNAAGVRITRNGEVLFKPGVTGEVVTEEFSK